MDAFDLLRGATYLTNKAYEQTDIVYMLDFGTILDLSLRDVGNQLLRTTLTDVVSNVMYDLSQRIGYTMPYTDALIENIISTLSNRVLGPNDAWVYKFRINPSTASISRRKLQTLTEYGHGVYDIEYYGNAFMSISFNGTTGHMMPPDPLPRIGITDVRLTVPYVKLAHLEKYYKTASQRLFLTLYGKVYMGYLDDMSYTYDANDPRQIKYSFTFMAHPYFIFDIFTWDFSGLTEYNNIIWDGLARPTQAMGLSNYGSILEYNNCGAAPPTALAWRPGG